MAEHHPMRPESLQPHTERSSRPGSEPSSVHADVYVWRYALLVVHARKRRRMLLGDRMSMQTLEASCKRLCCRNAAVCSPTQKNARAYLPWIMWSWLLHRYQVLSVQRRFTERLSGLSTAFYIVCWRINAMMMMMTYLQCFHCFDAVGWAAGRASGL